MTLDWLLGPFGFRSGRREKRKQLAHLVAAIFPQSRLSRRLTLSERYRDIDKVYEASERHPELKETNTKTLHLDVR